MSSATKSDSDGIVRYHPVREVRRGSRKALVDVELAELIRLLWMLGINTEACCQDSGESLADFARDNPHARSWVESLNGICLIDFADRLTSSGFSLLWLFPRKRTFGTGSWTGALRMRGPSGRTRSFRTSLRGLRGFHGSASFN